MRNTYTFPATLDYADDGISISFPDLPECFSSSETTLALLIIQLNKCMNIASTMYNTNNFHTIVYVSV